MATTTKAIQIKSGSTWYTLCPFPVGFIYMSYSNSSPASIYGGSWSTMTNGRYFRIHNNSTTRIGGSSTITTANLPSHTHTPSRRAFVQPNTGLGNGTFVTPGSELATYGWLVDNNKATGVSSTGATGGGKHFIQHIKMYMFGGELRSCSLLEEDALLDTLLGGDVND